MSILSPAVSCRTCHDLNAILPVSDSQQKQQVYLFVFVVVCCTASHALPRPLTMAIPLPSLNRHVNSQRKRHQGRRRQRSRLQGTSAPSLKKMSSSQTKTPSFLSEQLDSRSRCKPSPCHLNPYPLKTSSSAARYRRRTLPKYTPRRLARPRRRAPPPSRRPVRLRRHAPPLPSPCTCETTAMAPPRRRTLASEPKVSGPAQLALCLPGSLHKEGWRLSPICPLLTRGHSW